MIATLIVLIFHLYIYHTQLIIRHALQLFWLMQLPVTICLSINNLIKTFKRIVWSSERFLIKCIRNIAFIRYEKELTEFHRMKCKQRLDWGIGVISENIHARETVVTHSNKCAWSPGSWITAIGSYFLELRSGHASSKIFTGKFCAHSVDVWILIVTADTVDRAAQGYIVDNLKGFIHLYLIFVNASWLPYPNLVELS